MRSVLILSLLLATQPAFAAAQVKYYFGKVSYDAHGDEEPKEAVSLVKRVVFDDNNRIYETVVEKESGSEEPAKEFSTALVRQANSDKFDVSIAGLNMEGTMSFTDNTFSQWAYDLSIYPRDAEAWQKITGNGWISIDGNIHTKKKIEFEQGDRTILTIDRAEDLLPVSEAEYEARHKELLGK